MKKYAAFYAAYNAGLAAGNILSKEEQVASFTNGRTKSLRELSNDEVRELVAQLNKASKIDPTADKMRKALIAIFRGMGRSVENAKSWAEKQGVKGVKKRFNSYTTGELFVLIRLAEKIQSEQADILRQSMKSLSDR